MWTGLPDDHDPETVEVRDGLVVRRFPMPLPASRISAVSHATTTGWRTVRAHCAGPWTCSGPTCSTSSASDPTVPTPPHCPVCAGYPLVVTLQGETMMDDADIFDTSQVLRASLRAGLRTAAAVTACSTFTLDDAVARFGLAGRSGHGDLQRCGASTPRRTTAPAVDLPAALGGAALRAGPRPGGRQEGLRPPARRLRGHGPRPGAPPTWSSVARAAPSSASRPRPRSPASATGSTSSAGCHASRWPRPWRARRVFVMPSRLEPFGIVVLEAWRAATAVVATDRGGPPEFVRDGEDGLLVDPFDTAAVAAVLGRVLSDDDLRQVDGRGGPGHGSRRSRGRGSPRSTGPSTASVRDGRADRVAS